MVFGGGGCDAVVSTDFSGHGHDKKGWKDLLCDSWQVLIQRMRENRFTKGWLAIVTK